MEQSTQTNIYERVKKKVGRPKGTGLFTDEEKTSKNDIKAILLFTYRKRKGKTTIRLSSKIILFKLILIFNIPFLISINIWQPNYTTGDLQLYTRSLRQR